MRAWVITGPDQVEEQEVADGTQAIVVPIPTPPVFAEEGDFLPTVAAAYPTMLLQAHMLQHTDPRTPHRVTAFWPSSWRDQWGMDLLRERGIIS